MKTLFSFLVLAAGAVRAADNITPLDVKPGLWETTSVSERAGMPPIPAETLAKMQPEARARIEGMNKPQTTVSQSCVTGDEVKRFGQNQDKSCKVTTITSNSRHQEFHLECDRSGSKSTGTMKIDALDSTHVNTVVTVNVAAGGRPMEMKISNSGKWLGSDCGSVKPASAKQ